MPDTDIGCGPNPHWLADERQLRLECVRLAGGNVQEAQEILAFVTGRSDQTPAERITAAMREAGLI